MVSAESDCCETTQAVSTCDIWRLVFPPCLPRWQTRAHKKLLWSPCWRSLCKAVIVRLEFTKIHHIMSGYLATQSATMGQHEAAETESNSIPSWLNQCLEWPMTRFFLQSPVGCLVMNVTSVRKLYIQRSMFSPLMKMSHGNNVCDKLMSQSLAGTACHCSSCLHFKLANPSWWRTRRRWAITSGWLSHKLKPIPVWQAPFLFCKVMKTIYGGNVEQPPPFRSMIRLETHIGKILSDDSELYTFIDLNFFLIKSIQKLPAKTSMREWINEINCVVYYPSHYQLHFSLSVCWIHNVIVFLSFHISAHDGGSRQHLIEIFLSFSLPPSPASFPSAWRQAKHWSATSARSACGACASPDRSHAMPDSSASAVWGKQVRSPGAPTISPRDILHGDRTSIRHHAHSQQKKIAASFVTLQRQQVFPLRIFPSHQIQIIHSQKTKTCSFWESLRLLRTNHVVFLLFHPPSDRIWSEKKYNYEIQIVWLASLLPSVAVWTICSYELNLSDCNHCSWNLFPSISLFYFMFLLHS